MLQHSVPLTSQMTSEIHLVKKEKYSKWAEIEVDFQRLFDMLIYQIFTGLLQLEPKTPFPENHSSR